MALLTGQPHGSGQIAEAKADTIQTIHGEDLVECFNGVGMLDLYENQDLFIRILQILWVGYATKTTSPARSEASITHGRILTR